MALETKVSPQQKLIKKRKKKKTHLMKASQRWPAGAGMFPRRWPASGQWSGQTGPGPAEESHTQTRTHVSTRVKLQTVRWHLRYRKQRHVRDAVTQKLTAVLFCFQRSTIQRVPSFNFKCLCECDTRRKDSQLCVVCMCMFHL